MSYIAGEPVTVLLVAPSVTPWRARITPTIIKQARNPALRSIIYDTETLQILDVQQYFVNLTDANLKGEVNWELEYSFTNSYNVVDVSPQSIKGLLDDFKTEAEHRKFMTYYDHVTVMVNHPESVPKSCDCNCKRGHICSIQHVDVTAYDKCIEDTYCPDGGKDSSDGCVMVMNSVFIIIMCSFNLFKSL